VRRIGIGMRTFTHTRTGPTRRYGNAQLNAALTLIHSLSSSSDGTLGHGPVVSADDDAEIHEVRWIRIPVERAWSLYAHRICSIWYGRSKRLAFGVRTPAHRLMLVSMAMAAMGNLGPTGCASTSSLVGN
jgi:hypothetical protein